MRKIDLSAFQTATNFTARDINRRIVLDMIRTQQSISRAEIARRSGLQRSTISQIVEQLIVENWVLEGEIGRNLRGRRPRMLQLNLSRAGILGVSVRPLETTIAHADLNGRFHAQESFPTERDPEKFERELIARLQAFLAARPGIRWEGIGVGLPGLVDQATQRLVFSPNLGWRDLDLGGSLARATHLEVMVENASNACALAEVWFGEGEAGNLIVVTVAEGIGTGIIVNGELVHGAHGAGGEFGHVSLVEDGLPCPCGNRGCWERYASNTAALAYYRQLAGAQSPASPRDSDFPELLQLALHNEPCACAALEHMARYLGLGLAMLVTGLAPERVVIIGEVTQAWERIAPLLHRALEQRCGFHRSPRLIAANEAGQPRLRGTIALILQRHFAAPRVA